MNHVSPIELDETIDGSTSDLLVVQQNEKSCIIPMVFSTIWLIDHLMTTSAILFYASRERHRVDGARPVKQWTNGVGEDDHLAGDGNDAAGRDIAGGGEERTSPKTGTTWLAAALSAEAKET
jgi:hypothetical protein